MKTKDNFQFDFEKLNVYQKALCYIDKVFEVYNALPHEFKYAIGNNLVRAATSIANNIAEGNGKKSKKEKQRYFTTSIDSARESISVLNILKRQNLITIDKYSELRTDGMEITCMMNSLIKSQN